MTRMISDMLCKIIINKQKNEEDNSSKAQGHGNEKKKPTKP